MATWRELTGWLKTAQKNDANLIGAGAFDYLMLAGYTLVGYYWLRAAAIAEHELAAGNSDVDFYIGKRETARFFMQRLLPRANQHRALIESGSANLMDIPDSAFGR
ncbi:hypothetical protein D3C81_1963290 [compost metagenome]